MLRFSLPLLILLPLSLWAEHSGAPALVVFAMAGLGIIPYAALISRASEEIAERGGPVLGALVTAVFGNAAELIIAINGLRNGLVDVVKASITGAILNDLLFVIGLAMLFGGLNNGEQSFQPRIVRANSAAMTLAAIALALPASLIATSGIHERTSIHSLSLIVAVILIAIYGLTVLFSILSGKEIVECRPVLHKPCDLSEERETGLKGYLPWILLLLASTAGIAIQSEVFVSALEPATTMLGFSGLFTGVMIIPLVGGFSEYFPATFGAVNNKMDLPMSLAVGSSLLMALLIGPLLVLYSNSIGQPMDLDFSSFEVITLFLSVVIVNLVTVDARSNWLEGALLIATYLIIGTTFFYFPA